MTWKKILSKFTSDQKEKKEIFFALEISSGLIKSAVWTVVNNKTTVLKTGSLEEWEEENPKSLISAVDISLTNASEKISPEPNKVIFGLPEEWIKGEEIKKEKKEILKNLCQKLALKAVGFVVTLEALVTFLKQKEGTPISAIFITLSETQSAITLVKLGKIKNRAIVGRSEDLAADVREGLAHFGQVENFPARMILYNGISDFEEAKQQLISFDWQKELSFFHFPKVETLKVLTPIKAIALAGGAEVAKSLGFEIKVQDKKKKEEEKAVEEKLTAKDLGFTSPSQEKAEVKEVENFTKEKQQIKENQLKNIGQKIKIKPKIFLPKLKLNKLKFVKRLLKSSFSFLLLPFIFLIIFIIAGFAFYWYAPKASVAIYLKPKKSKQEINFFLNLKQKEKKDDLLPASKKTIIVEGEKEKETTGEKIIGDKAKGEIIIYNKTSVAKSFPKGTILISPDKIAFNLDEEVMIASQSSSIDENEVTVITPGTASSHATAQSIGAKANLAPGTKLSFKGYSNNLFLAKSEKGFSGGTSRQIKVVSSEDKTDLINNLTNELQKKAKEKAHQGISLEKEVLDKIIKEKVVVKDFSAEENEEVDNLKLKLKIEFDFLTYDKNDLQEIIKKTVDQDLLANYNFNYDSSPIETQSIAVKNDKIQVKALVNLNFLPRLDKDKIKNQLRGHYPAATQEYLKTLPGFSRADIKITPHLPAKLNTFPRIAKNINIEIKIEP